MECPGPMNSDTIRNAMDSIAGEDVDVARGLEQVGYPQPRIRPPGFETFVAIIVSQQLSNRAAGTIMSRVRDRLPEFRAEMLLALPEGVLRDAGLSGRKVEYATELAEAVVAGRFDPYELDRLDDTSAIDRIIALRGFGRWSAEVYLMFSLQRPDVFPADDLALRKSLQKLKRLEESPAPAAARQLVRCWSPWRSVGSLFLWHYYRGVPA